MVGKLMKHELYALLRILALFAGAVLLLSILTRVSYTIIEGMGDDMGAVVVSLTFVIVIFNVCVFALSIAPVIVSAERFYKSLFTGEGYLTFSLPVTASQLILSKLLSAIIASVGCIAIALVSSLIAGPQDVSLNLEIFPALREYFAADPLIGVEIVILMVLSIPSGFFYLYLITSIGQLFTKGRKLVTIGLYFGISFVLSYAFLAIVPVVEFDNVHAILWTFIAAFAAFDVGSFFAIRYILTHKVNLIMG